MNRDSEFDVSASRGWAAALDAAVEAQRERMVEVRRHLHRHPEPSEQEFETTRYLASAMASAGLSHRIGPGETGVIVECPGTRSGAADGERIALRADIDALLIHDDKSEPYRSNVPGVMHACGHDGHAATVLGAIFALAEAESAGRLPWPVPWRAIFQPAEETCTGALRMIQAGALDGVGAILAMHMDPSRPAGVVAMRAKALTADCDELRITVQGRGGHAARPHESLDPIAIAAQLISSIYLFVPRAVDTHDSCVVTIGRIAGGGSPNVIPDCVEMAGTLRSIGGKVRQRAIDHIEQLARGLAEASATRIDVAFDYKSPSVYNDPALTALVHDVAEALLGEDRVHRIPKPSMGGEDFAYYLQHVPGCMFRLGCAAGGEAAPPLHSNRFDLDERALVVGAKLMARSAVMWADPSQR